mmetsp:Transcript_13904/g.31057  ORF Transcript_13904/g.31057 Transcript_13904/m.31057 type:complete len:1041 (-) Transcript_13904:122-3244(-)
MAGMETPLRPGPAPEDARALWWYLLHSPDQYILLTHAPPWLAGGVLAVFSAMFASAGMAFMKLAFERQKRAAKEQSDEEDVSLLEDTEEVEEGGGHRGRRPRRDSFASVLDQEREKMLTSSVCFSTPFWLCLCILCLAGLLYAWALTFAPETTVAPLGLVQVITNLPLAYGMLHERFSRGDVMATLACILGMAGAVIAMPRNVPGHLKDFPVVQFMDFCDDMTNNYGFMSYLIFWTVLVLLCLNGNYAVKSSVRQNMRAFTMPTLAGLFTAAASFLLKLVGTLYYHSDQHPEVWTHRSTMVLLWSMILFCLLALFFVCQGLKFFDCRFFVPATFAVSSVLMIVQGVLFFREWDGMTSRQLVSFDLACILTVVSVFFISWEHDSVHTPASVAGLGDPSPTNSPRASSWPNKAETAVLTIMEEHGTRALEPERGWRPVSSYTELGAGYSGAAASSNGFDNEGEGSDSDSGSDDSESSEDNGFGGPAYADIAAARRWLSSSCRGRAWTIVCKILPLLLFCLMPIVPVLLFKLCYTWQAFSLLTFYTGYSAWKFGLHIALFSNVGRMKMKAYSQVRFEQLFGKLAAFPESPEAKAPMRFDEVLHFVILTNYKEDLEIMKEAIMSVAASGISKGQISLVLAMEEREAGASEKAENVIKELGHLFRHMLYTMHPPGIPGEQPGKSANCRWAAQRLFEEVFPRLGIDLEKVVLTVMDADSEFHPEYFGALTYQFLTAPGAEARFNTIWQAPIIHYKNYHSQPMIVRLGSLLTSQHELANLADPSSTRMPYSTYSISGVLARAVDGWDPDWISEDWHMSCKCFCASIGALNIAPIFLPVMNYTPEADSWIETLWARWTQAKRHALGVSELVYFAGTAPFIVFDKKFGFKRRWRLGIMGYFLWVKMLLVHGLMATATVMGPLNGICISFFYRSNLIGNVNSFTFLANCVFQFFSVATFVIYLYTNVRLYDKVSYRIVGSDDPKVQRLWGRQGIHFVMLVVGCLPLAPVLFFIGGLCEWIAAAKTAFTHRFEYEVALKPQAATKVQPAES